MTDLHVALMIGIRSLGFCVALAGYAVAQSSQPLAQCTNSTYDWTFNSLGQSPCAITAILGGVCNEGRFNVPPLPGPNFNYVGPGLGNDNACLCSSVFYSLLSACSLCQSARYYRWLAYTTNCSVSYPGVFPFDIPTSTKVPHWAYLDVVRDDGFSPEVAQAALGGAESTNVLQITRSTNLASMTPYFSASSAPPSPPSSSPSPSSSSSSPNLRATAGFLVGGVVGLIFIVQLIF